MKENETVGVALPKAMKISSVSVTGNNLESLKVQTSINGIVWKDVESTIEDGTLKATVDATATYVRVVNKTSNSIDITIDSMILSPVYNTGNKTVETDLGTYGNNVIANALDGNINTKFYSSAGATVGSYVRVDLGKEIPLYDTAIYYAGNPKGPAHGIDGFAATKMEISTDGVSWTQIGDIIKDENYQSKTVEGQLVSEAAFNADGQMARYIRFSATESSDNWVQVFEIPFNKTVDNLGDDSIDIIDTTITTGNVSNLYDRDLTSAFAPDSVVDEDTLTYAMTSITNVGRLMIMQDPTSICNATVSVKDAEGNWSDIGTLDKGTNTFDVNKTILEVKLTFHANNPTPSIYEIIASQKEVEETDKTALKIAVDLANVITDEDLANVVPVVVEEFKAARNEANEVYNDASATQEQVNNAFDRLASAMQKLEFYVGDKTALKAFIDKVSSLEADKYIEATWIPFNEALTAANGVYEDVNAMQPEVNEAYTNLVNAFLNLRLIPDKSLLEELINQANGINAANYTKASYKVLSDALNEAKEVLNNPNATQEQVDSAKATLEKAISGLQTVSTDNTVSTPVNKGDKTVSVKTGDDVNMLGTLGLISSLGVIAFLKKRKGN
jgi:hyaluronoglucosaminidase